MLPAEELIAFERRLRRGALLPRGHGRIVGLDRTDIERLIPHRGRMLLVDGIDAIAENGLSVRGYRRLAPTDAGFDGHFPGDPIYPGVLVVEAIGQLALTLIRLGAARAAPTNVEARVRVTRIHHAAFLAPFRPCDTMRLHAEVTDLGLTSIAIGQAFLGTELAVYAIAEVLVDA